MRHLLSTQGLLSEIMDKNKKDEPYNPKLIYKDKAGTSLYIGMAPGKKDRKWNRCLEDDLNNIKSLGVRIVVCLLAPHEVTKLKIKNYEDQVGSRGMKLVHVPIKDMSIPSLDSLFMLSSFISKEICMGKSVLIHCRCGKGRSKTIAGAVLSCLGQKHNSLENSEGKIDIAEDQIKIIHLHSVSISRQIRPGSAGPRNCAQSYSCNDIHRRHLRNNNATERNTSADICLSKITHNQNVIYSSRVP